MSRKRKHKNKNTDVLIIDKPVKFTYTIRLEALLLDICDNISFAIIGSHMETNPYGFKLLDLSENKGKFKIYIEGRKTELINIQDFIDRFFDKKFSNREIEGFINEYNKRLPDVYDDIDYTLVDVSPYEKDSFEYKPKDVFYTFNSLCYQTYPFGTEDFILKYIPIPLQEDKFGNYYIKIGESDTMFTSHFDSACLEHQKVKLMSFEKGGNILITSDGKTILSADDKSGVTIMLYMIEHNIPGLYYFFIGEERGGIGSGMVAKEFENLEYLKGINKCISFDRRNYYSIITHQSWTRTCSDNFAESLCQELNKNGMNMKLDDTGLFTDSANFIEYIPECTNISVGYFNEHTTQEYQNITFLENLCKACVNVDWSNLTISRKLYPHKEVIDRNYDLIMDFKDLKFFCDVKLRAVEERVFIQLRIVSSPFGENYEDLKSIYKLFDKYNLDPYLYFIDDNDGSMLINIEIE